MNIKCLDTICNNPSHLALTAIFIILIIINIIRIIREKNFSLINYLAYIWIFFLIFFVSEIVSFKIAYFIWGFLCFITLREYFSLVDIRLQDRFAVLIAYLSIPFMIYFVYIDWYSMFIISIPVYTFLVVPFLISIGGKEREGTINSIGVIDFGLFLFVYCIGHIIYLTFYSTWMACMLILNVLIYDISSYFIDKKVFITWKKILFKFFVPLPFTITLTLLISLWTKISHIHSVILACLIPMLAIIGGQTIMYIKSDLCILEENLKPGKGLIIDNAKSIVYSAPVVFHYIRYFLL